MGGYRTLAEIELVMDSIASENPLIVKPKWSIGQSIEGRDIYVMKVSDNPLVDEDELEIYYNAAIHAREVITPEVLVYYLRYLTNNYGIVPQVTYLIDNREMFFCLCENPDGYQYNYETDPGGGGMWRKNRRNNGGGEWGVDLNRNYGYQWGYDDNGSSPNPGSVTYRGTGPFSEPETQMQRDFIMSREFVITITYHSYSNLIIWPWGYDYFITPDNDIFTALGDSASQYNSYTPEPSHALYLTNGTTDDWGYGEQTLKNKNYAITIEVGSYSDNYWPPTSRITPLVEENLGANLYYARFAENPEKLRVPAPPTIHAVDTVETAAFTLAWNHEDTTNPAVAFEVWQYRDLSRTTDDLESGGANWQEDGFILSTARAHSGLTSYYSQSSSNLDNRVTAKQSICVNPDDTLRFWTWYDIEPDWDYGYVEVSTDGGQSWVNIAGNITTTSNPNGSNMGNGITGYSGGWILAEFDLSSYAAQDISMRFRYKSDAYVNEEGWYIDDIYPLDVFAETIQLASQHPDTTILVEGLVEDTFYYQVYAFDAENQKSGGSAIETVIVQFGPSCTWLVGDADGNGFYNISDVVYLINYCFGGGPAPTPHAIGSGDADCSMSVSIADVVYFISYIFAGGPAPGTDCTCADY